MSNLVSLEKKKRLGMQERPKNRLLHVWVTTGDSWSR